MEARLIETEYFMVIDNEPCRVESVTPGQDIQIVEKHLFTRIQLKTTCQPNELCEIVHLLEEKRRCEGLGAEARVVKAMGRECIIKVKSVRDEHV